MGNGKQWFPWIHLNDLLTAFWYIVENKNMKGIYNFCAPEPIRNRDLAKTIGRILHRPSFLKAPGFVIRLFMGEMGASILGSQRAVPENLLSQGFKFSYPDFHSAMTEIIGGS